MAVPLPDRATLDAAHRRAEEERAFLDAHRDALTRAYPDEFIAVRHGEVLDHDVDFMVLADRLQDREIPANEIRFFFLATKPECYLL